MIDLVPELKLIIGDQPPVPDLPPQEAQGRFQLVFRRFIGVFARPEHPLALFLDDLQWLDAATLDLLEDLLTRPDVQHLMLIGAYRDNEVTAAHPLMRKLEAIRNAGANVQEITLAPLAGEDVRQFIADALRCEPERAAPLAQLVHEKTAGNPFFADSVSSRARRRRLAHVRSWRRPMVLGPQSHPRQGVRGQRRGSHGGQVEPPAGRNAEGAAATRLPREHRPCPPCCHSSSGNRPRKCMRISGSAVRLELVEHLEGSYKFVHDRVQEAAYSLIPEELRDEAHLRIGRQLAEHIPPEKREEAIFDIVNQLNRGAALITSRDEREQLAELNLTCGQARQGLYCLRLGAEVSRRRCGTVGRKTPGSAGTSLSSRWSCTGPNASS